MADPADHLGDEARHAAGEAWLAASSWAIDAQGAITQDRAGLEARLAGPMPLPMCRTCPKPTCCWRA
jgi:cobaltochelatase CobN